MNSEERFELVWDNFLTVYEVVNKLWGEWPKSDKEYEHLQYLTGLLRQYEAELREIFPTL